MSVTLTNLVGLGHSLWLLGHQSAWVWATNLVGQGHSPWPAVPGCQWLNAPEAALVQSMQLYPSALPAGPEATRAPLLSHPVPGSVSCLYSPAGPPQLLLSPSPSQKAVTPPFVPPWSSISLLFWVHQLQSSPGGSQEPTSAADTAAHLQLLSATVHLILVPASLQGKGNHLFSPMEGAKHLYGSLYPTQKSLLVLFIKPLMMLKHAKYIKNLLNSKYTLWL